MKGEIYRLSVDVDCIDFWMRHTKGLDDIFHRRLMGQYPPDRLRAPFVFKKKAEITVERDSDGNPLSSSIAQAESDADRLAYELLAPAEHVLGDIPGSKQALARRLREFYGFPATQAARYAGVLMPPVRTDPLLLRLRSFA